MTSDSDDVTGRMTVTAVVSDQRTVVLFEGELVGSNVTFAADHLTAATILEALRAGETPTVDVPYWAVLGCPEWCGNEDLHDEERIERAREEGLSPPTHR